MKLLLHWLVTGCVCCVLPLAAHAQWQWTDKNGKTVFSDTAPPPEVPEKNIQRRGNAPAPRPNPNVVVLNPGADAEAKPAPAAAAPVAAKPEAKSGADKELEDKVKQAEEAEKAKKAAEAQKIAQAKAENCTRARQAKATYDSGIRVARLNAQGEREIIDDTMRAEEQKRLQGIIASDCK
jgi:hypothetical protein